MLGWALARGGSRRAGCTLRQDACLPRPRCPPPPRGAPPPDPAGGDLAGGQSVEQMVGMLSAEGPKAFTVDYVKVFGKR